MGWKNRNLFQTIQYLKVDKGTDSRRMVAEVNDYYQIEGKDKDEPIISIILPTFNSCKTVAKAVDSIIDQTFNDWEMLIINDYGSDDGTADIIRDYIRKDSRIKLVQTNKRIGLADSLNLGIKLSKGKYIARMDSDDYSLPKRLEEQYRLMEKDETIGICGTWQLHTGKNRWVHRAAKEDERCRAHLLFWCDLCHSTLMLRKDVFISNELHYDKEYKAEDYELWTRAMRFTKIRNIPKVLGIYSEDDGITNTKIDDLSHENGLIVSNNLQHYFGIELNEDEKHLFDQWNHSLKNDSDRIKKLSDLERILREIDNKNNESGSFERRALLEAMANVWYKSRYDSDIGSRIFFVPKKIDKIFNDKSISSKIARYRTYIRDNASVMTKIKGFFVIFFDLKNLDNYE